MNLNKIFRIVNIVSGKKLNDTVLTPEQAMLLLHQAQLKHMRNLITGPQDGKAFEIDRYNSASLAPFKVFMGKNGSMPLYVDNYGDAVMPSDTFYPSTLSYLYNSSNRKIDIVSDEEWALREGDALTKGTERNPIANIQDASIRFSPLKNKYVAFVYIKNPIEPVYGVDQSDGYPKYDRNTSTELEWNEQDQIDIIYILLSDLGIKMEKAEVIQVAEKVKQTEL